MAGRQPGFRDVEERLRELSAQGDPLEKVGATVAFEIVRAGLDAAPGPRARSKGGRPPFDAVLKLRMAGACHACTACRSRRRSS